MINWLMTNWMTQLATVVFAIWFARGVWKATMRPRLTYISHHEVKERGAMLTVRRQERLPPWRELEETWFLEETRNRNGTVTGVECFRESDGKRAWVNGPLDYQLCGLLAAKRARDAVTDEILEQEARPN